LILRRSFGLIFQRLRRSRFLRLRLEGHSLGCQITRWWNSRSLQNLLSLCRSSYLRFGTIGKDILAVASVLEGGWDWGLNNLLSDLLSFACRRGRNLSLALVGGVFLGRLNLPILGAVTFLDNLL
jgi:hypothetical protein